MADKASFVIDSWPVLEWLQHKTPVAYQFSEFLNKGVAADSSLMISRMNWGEIMYMLPKKINGQRLEEAEAIAQRLPFMRVSVDDDLVDAATELKKRYACSYADCFAVALAIRFHAPVVTGDREFLPLRDDGLITLEWLGV